MRPRVAIRLLFELMRNPPRHLDGDAGRKVTSLVQRSLGDPEHYETSIDKTLLPAAAMELGPKGIRVNSVHPGMIDTGMTRIHGGDAAMEWGGQKVALKRVGLPEDVVGMYLFLASDESAYCTGAEFVVDGGATAS